MNTKEQIEALRSVKISSWVLEMALKETDHINFDLKLRWSEKLKEFARLGIRETEHCRRECIDVFLSSTLRARARR